MTILDEIFAFKREEIAHLEATVSLDDLKAQAEDMGPARGFVEALKQSRHKPALIAEVKKASPVKGVIRPNFDPVDVARSYEAVGVDCLSVLTDEKYFQGSPDFLRRVKDAVPMPVLRKDFTADPYHVWQAKAMGADALLLIVAMLDPGALEEMHGLAKEIGLDVLVEVHTAEEAETALSIGADLIGVNNRDLKTFEISLEHSRDVIPMLNGRAVAVSESALHSKENVEQVSSWGADAVLIGTAFCKADDPGQKAKEIMGW
jgi:indole-3-glycerol phosphate synthase